MSLKTTRWAASAAWVALTMAVFLVSDVFSRTDISGWFLAPAIALLPPLVVTMLLGQEDTSSESTALHVVERRRGK